MADKKPTRNPRVLIAPDKFKGTLSAAEVAQAIRRGVCKAVANAKIDTCPMADGGEGTVDALVTATGGELHKSRVTGPLGEQVDAVWGMLGDQTTAIIEMAQAAGLVLVPTEQRDTTRTTTYGVGELIRCAMDDGATKIIVGLGGSATTDGGAGMAQAMGVRFGEVNEPLTGGDLKHITAVDMSKREPRLDHVKIIAACDVTNPLTGPNGAAAVYGPQKGATSEQIDQLDIGLQHLASLVSDVDAEAPGMGATGGLGFGLIAFCNAKMQSGIELVIEAVNFDRRVAECDLLITGEGRLDGQSIHGKTCIGVAQAAAKHGVPTIALAGCIGEDAEKTLDHGLTAYHALTDLVSIHEVQQNAAALLEQLAKRVVSNYLR